MRLVLRANDLVHFARQAHEESVILTAQSQFLRRGINDQLRLLSRLRKSLGRTYTIGKHEFERVIKDLDATNGRLEATMDVLRRRIVESAFRPDGEEEKNLLDFVDEGQVHYLQDTIKKNIKALQVSCRPQPSRDSNMTCQDLPMLIIPSTEYPNLVRRRLTPI